MFDLIDAFAKGYSHINDETSRGEDYGKTFKSDLCHIFAVADGHGDSNCPRSSYGSEVACNVAANNLKIFCEGIAGNSLESEILEAGEDFKRRAKQLITSIVCAWSAAVKEEYESNPLTDEERAGCDKYLELYAKGDKIEHIYGTTLIAGLLTDKYLLLLQQGDGRCDVFDEEKKEKEYNAYKNKETQLEEEKEAVYQKLCLLNPKCSCGNNNVGMNEHIATEAEGSPPDSECSKNAVPV